MLFITTNTNASYWKSRNKLRKFLHDFGLTTFQICKRFY